MKLSYREKLIWAAGLLEGEGFFGLKSKNTGTIKGNILVACNMTDKDVLVKLKNYLKVGSLSGPYTNGKGNKLRWAYKVSGEPAYKIIKDMIPFMGKRRSDKISNLIYAYQNCLPKKEWEVKNIETGLTDKFSNMTNWCKDNNVSVGKMSEVCNKKRDKIKSWVFVRIIDNSEHNSNLIKNI